MGNPQLAGSHLYASLCDVGRPGVLEPMNPDAPHYHDHRQRLRDRLLKAGRQAFADYELLELLLTYAIPRKDTKPIAKRLLKRFGSFAAIFDQPRERLLEIEGVGPQTCTFLFAIREFLVRYLEQGVECAKAISSPEDIAEFVRTHLGTAQRECLMILYLNDANRLAHHVIVSEGTVDRAPFYPREILKTAFLRNATGLIMVHNHPSGDPIPSENDHRITSRMEKLAAEFEIKVHDHLIVTPHRWYLADLSKAQGKQELFTHQSPQKLKILREHALIESAISSNRIEGINVDQSRIDTLILGKPLLKDRDEEEVRGYRDALRLIHKKAGGIPVSEKTILKFHKLSRGQIWDAGKYKEKNIDIIQKYPDGRQRICFRTVPADQTPQAMSKMIELWSRGLRERWAHPFILLAVLNLDFLYIHPFRDGNGRISRLLLLLTCYHSGLEVGRYISLERLIEQNKERYYETLEQSSQGWHEGSYDPWPYINYILSILKNAYREFEDRVDQLKSPRGAKTEQVEAAVKAFTETFTLYELERACMGVSRDMVRKVLRNLQKTGFVECLGWGPGAVWRKKR